MRRLIAILLCCIVPIALFAAENSYKVKYDGGSLSDVKAGTDMKMVLESDKVRFVLGKVCISGGEAVLLC